MKINDWGNDKDIPTKANIYPEKAETKEDATNLPFEKGTPSEYLLKYREIPPATANIPYIISNGKCGKSGKFFMFCEIRKNYY